MTDDTLNFLGTDGAVWVKRRRGTQRAPWRSGQGCKNYFTHLFLFFCFFLLKQLVLSTITTQLSVPLQQVIGPTGKKGARVRGLCLYFSCIHLLFCFNDFMCWLFYFQIPGDLSEYVWIITQDKGRTVATVTGVKRFMFSVF